MKIHRILPPLMIFSAFLLTGLLSGLRIGNHIQRPDPGISSSYSSAKPTFPVPGQSPNQMSLQTSEKPARIHKWQPSQYQHNILILGIDDMSSATPQLESVWLAMYLTNMPRIIMMPIHPTIVSSGGVFRILPDLELDGSFSLSGLNAPSVEFQNILKDRGLWWNAFIVLDEEAMVGIVEFLLEKPTRDMGEINVVDRLAKLPSSQLDPANSLLAQTSLIQDLCRSTMHLELETDKWLRLYEKLEDHIMSDIDPRTTAKELLSLLKNGNGLFCEFPSMISP